jgi:hypothetical protein
MGKAVGGGESDASVFDGARRTEAKRATIAKHIRVNRLKEVGTEFTRRTSMLSGSIEAGHAGGVNRRLSRQGFHFPNLTQYLNCLVNFAVGSSLV